MNKSALIGIPLIVVFAVAFINITTIANGNCLYQTGTACGNMDVSGSLLNNPLSWIIGTWTTQKTGGGWAVGSFQWIAAQFSSVSGGIVLGGISMVGFSIFGGITIAGSSLGLDSESRRFLLSMGIGFIIWGWLSSWSGLLFALPWYLGQLMWGVLTIMYCWGIYELARSHF